MQSIDNNALVDTRKETVDADASSDDGVHQLDKPFRLLDLPPELWSRICKLAVVHKRPIYVVPWNRDIHQPRITKVCRLIRDECLPHFYSGNMFFTYASEHLTLGYVRTWLQIIGNVNRTRLRRLCLYWEDKPWTSRALHHLETMGMTSRKLNTSDKAYLEAIGLSYEFGVGQYIVVLAVEE